MIYQFDCGCKFEVINESPLRLKFEPDIEKITLDCPKTWELIGNKSCKGVFQLDSHFAEHITHEFKPKNIDELALCIAMNRPGCLDAYTDDNKTITQSILDRRNKKEEVKVLEPIKEFLEKSYGHMVYQEQMMAIAAKLAGFDPGMVNKLRKSCAKKDTKLMSELRQKFIDGCKTIGIVNDDIANHIFDNIEATQRYSFCAAHAVGYSLLTYWTAYKRAHIPKCYTKANLKYAIDKQKPFEEINELVGDARNNSIDVYTPDLRNLNKDFSLINSEIYFGLGDIRGIGESILKRLDEIVIETEKKVGARSTWKWLDILFYVLPFINSTAAKAIICSGSIDFCKVPRSTMYYEFEHYIQLKDREQNWIIKAYEKDKSKTLIQLINDLVNVPSGKIAGGCSSKKRLEAVNGILNLLKNPPFSIEDSIEWIAGVEQELMGISLSCTKVDACDISAANCDCRSFINGYSRPGPILIAVKIDRIKEIVTKKGDKMCFLNVGDISGNIDSVVVFPNVYSSYKLLIIDDNTVMLSGKRDEKNKSNLIVDKVFQL